MHGLFQIASSTVLKSRRGKKKIHKAGKGYLSCTTSRLQETLQAQFATKRPIGREPLTFTRSLLFWSKETHHGLPVASIWGFASCPWNIQLCGERVRRASGDRHNVQVKQSLGLGQSKLQNSEMTTYQCGHKSRKHVCYFHRASKTAGVGAGALRVVS